MSYKNRDVQPELFSGLEKKHKKTSFRKRLFPVNKSLAVSISYDALIVVIITLLMINLVSFVCGIERGKNLTKINNNKSDLKLRAKAKSLKKTIVPKNNTRKGQTQIIPEQKIKVGQNNPPNSATRDKKYTIQLVTYSKEGLAKIEVDRLKANGFKSFLLKKGKYFVVYSGIYNTRKGALKKVNHLKKRYKDCLVRRFEWS